MKCHSPAHFCDRHGAVTASPSLSFGVWPTMRACSLVGCHGQACTDFSVRSADRPCIINGRACVSCLQLVCLRIKSNLVHFGARNGKLMILITRWHNFGNKCYCFARISVTRDWGTLHAKPTFRKFRFAAELDIAGMQFRSVLLFGRNTAYCLWSCAKSQLGILRRLNITNWPHSYAGLYLGWQSFREIDAHECEWK